MTDVQTREAPVAARVHLAHAVVQSLADRDGIDLLHIKGPAVLSGLRDPARQSSDVDVLVRPGHLQALVEALESVGFEQRTGFATGSVFAHAANWWHDDWGWVDVHITWPGVTIDPDEAFDVLWQARVPHQIAHWPCAVPDRTAQRLILVLHSARSGRATDEGVWPDAAPEEQGAVRALASRLRADVALAAGIGELEQHRRDPTYRLWRHFSQGGSRYDEWRARLASARGIRAKAALLGAVTQVNRDHLRMELGRAPTSSEVRARQALRLRRAVTELASRVRRR